MDGAFWPVYHRGPLFVLFLFLNGPYPLSRIAKIHPPLANTPPILETSVRTQGGGAGSSVPEGRCYLPSSPIYS